MHRLREHEPRHPIVQFVVHPQERAVVFPFEVWLGDGAVAAVGHDVAEEFVLGSVADGEEVFRVDDQGVAAEV